MGKKILIIVPARGGSKGLPGKNIRKLKDKPLLIHTTDAVHKLTKKVDLVISTDDEKIIQTCNDYQIKVSKRPKELATDTSLVIDTVKYTVRSEEISQNMTYDYVVLLEPTSPLRSVELLDECLDALLKDGITSVATYCETDIPPTRTWRIINNTVTPFIENSNPWLPRQKHETAYQLSGLFYGISRNELMRDETRSLITSDHFAKIVDRRLSIDIDTIDDFNYIEYLMEQK